MAAPVEFVTVQTQRAQMAAEITTLLGQGRRIGQGDRGIHLSHTGIAVLAFQEKARA